jgi:uncharacterized YigZ family protein
MLKDDIYKTIEFPSEGIFKDKGSKFISYAYPVSDENSIKDIVQRIKKEHYSARHHCYAYRLGYAGENYRTNDDGEPSGTAGRPIHGQLLSKELSNILVVVVRYFGGTLLGVSGLINAYKCATIDAIANAEVVTKIIYKKFYLQFDYQIQNSVMRIIKDEHLEIVKSEYQMFCTLELLVRLQKMECVLDKFNKIEELKINEI